MVCLQSDNRCFDLLDPTLTSPGVVCYIRGTSPTTNTSIGVATLRRYALYALILADGINTPRMGPDAGRDAAVPSMSSVAAVQPAASGSTYDEPQDDSAYCLVTCEVPCVGTDNHNRLHHKQPHPDPAGSVQAVIYEPYRRLWTLVSVATLDLACAAWFYLRTSKFEATMLPIRDPAQQGLIRLIGLGLLRSITSISIGLSTKWRKAQFLVIAGLVFTLLGVLWEVNLAVQWRGWDSKQSLGQVQGQNVLMIDFAVFGKVMKMRMTILAQLLIIVGPSSKVLKARYRIDPFCSYAFSRPSLRSWNMSVGPCLQR